MELNILTRRTGKTALNEYEIAFSDYWRIYLRLLATIGQVINQREEDIMSYILSRPQEEPAELKGRHIPIISPGLDDKKCLCGKPVGSSIHVTEQELFGIYRDSKEAVPVNYFLAPHANLMRHQLNLARSEVTRLKTSLKAKRIIDDNDLPVAALLRLREQSIKSIHMQYIFPLKIVT